MRVYVDPASDILYSSFYIKGLYDQFQKANVFFSSKYFKTFKHDNHFFSFVIESNASTHKIVIDFTDSSEVDKEALDWSDLYGKINLVKEKVNSDKLFPIGPSFGINIFTLRQTLWYGIANFLSAYNRIPNKRTFFSNYKAQLKRLKLDEYNNVLDSEEDFIYFVSSIWKKEIKTNEFRANFIRASKSFKNIKTEVGFAPRATNDVKGYEDITFINRHDVAYYFEQIKKSRLVFNTPAVLDCHGWKLAEYFALGKAILSTPLSRELSSPVKNELQLLYTDGSYIDMIEKIDLMLQNNQLVIDLERNSKAYFNDVLAPKAVISNILNRLEYCNQQA